MLNGHARLRGLWTVCFGLGVKLPVPDLNQRACTQDESERYGGRFHDTRAVDWLHDGNRNSFDRITIWPWSSASLDGRTAACVTSFDAGCSKTRPAERGARCPQFWRGEQRDGERGYSVHQETTGRLRRPIQDQ